jgi:crotonobetainyl-CoA:carnitine CoA-transferase CaiB-like acyl-CoA transferase
MTLADLGAKVLRVTSASRPDLVSLMPPLLPGRDMAAGMAYLGRGKRTVKINLKAKEAPAVVKRLLGSYDILIEQFRPGVMARAGLDYAGLSQVRPDLIYLSLTGYGQNGPLAARAGHDINYLARSGIMAYSGRRGELPPLMGIQIGDIAAGGLQAVVGILAAVLHRQKTGEGQYIDLAITDSLMSFHALTSAGFLVDGQEPGREETLLNGGSHYDFYETRDGKYVSVGALEPKFFAALCDTLAAEDPQVKASLLAGGEEAKEKMRGIFLTKTRRQWEEQFQGVEACVEPVLSLKEALEDPQARARGMVTEVGLARGGKVCQIANPIKFSRSCATPGIFDDGEEEGRQALREAGFTEEEITAGEKSGLFS